MNQDLEWLAINEPQWAMDDDNYLMIKKETGAVYVDAESINLSGCYGFCPAFTRAQWQSARDELKSPYSGNPERFNANGRLQIKQWGAAEDDFLAPEIGVVESFLGHSFSTPEEDEEWDAIAKKQNCSVCGCKNKQMENEKLRAQIQSLRDYCDRLLAGEMG